MAIFFMAASTPIDAPASVVKVEPAPRNPVTPPVPLGLWFAVGSEVIHDLPPPNLLNLLTL